MIINHIFILLRAWRVSCSIILVSFGSRTFCYLLFLGRLRVAISTVLLLFGFTWSCRSSSWSSIMHTFRIFKFVNIELNCSVLIQLSFWRPLGRCRWWSSLFWLLLLEFKVSTLLSRAWLHHIVFILWRYGLAAMMLLIASIWVRLSLVIWFVRV